MENLTLVKDLVRRIAEDDSHAFTEFYELYYSKVLSFSRYFSNSATECKEIVSDVFFYLWMNRKKLPDLQNIDGYLYTSIRNQALKYINQNKRFPTDQLEDIPLDIYIETNSPEKILITHELKTIIEKAVNELPNRCKFIFLLIREHGLKYKEVAEMLSISDRTVQAQMIIATKKITESVRSYYPNLLKGNTFLLLLLNFKKK